MVFETLATEVDTLCWYRFCWLVPSKTSPPWKVIQSFPISDNLTTSTRVLLKQSIPTVYSRFRDFKTIYGTIHISVSCIYQKPETPHRRNQKIPTKVIEISWNIRPSSLIFTLGCTPLVIYQLHSKLDSWRHIFIHSPTNSTTNNSAPKLRKRVLTWITSMFTTFYIILHGLS